MRGGIRAGPAKLLGSAPAPMSQPITTLPPRLILDFLLVACVFLTVMENSPAIACWNVAALLTVRPAKLGACAVVKPWFVMVPHTVPTPAMVTGPSMVCRSRIGG